MLARAARVARDDLAGHVRGIVRGEERDDVRDVGAFRLVPERTVEAAACGLFRIEREPAFGVDVARRAAVDSDAERREVERERAHHGVDRALGGAVGGAAADRAHGGVGREEDDDAARFLLHEEAVARRLRHAEAADDIRLENVPESFGIHLQRPAVAEPLVRGVVDEDVQPPRVAFDRVEQRRDLRGIGDVARLRNHAVQPARLDLGGSLGGGGFAQPAHVDLRPVAGEPLDEIEPRVSVAARHQDDLAVKPAHNLPCRDCQTCRNEWNTAYYSRRHGWL